MSRIIYSLIAAILIVSASCNLRCNERRNNIKNNLQSLNPAEIVQMYMAFINGTQLFVNLPDQDACNVQTYPEILGDFNYIVNSIKEFDINGDVAAQLIDILKTLEDVIPNLVELNKRCNAYQAAASARITALQNYLLDPNYLLVNLGHLIGNINEIKARFQNLDNEYQNKDYVDAAGDLGSLVRDLFFSTFN